MPPSEKTAEEHGGGTAGIKQLSGGTTTDDSTRLRERNEYQARVAGFGRRALECRSLSEIAAEAVTAGATGLATPLASLNRWLGPNRVLCLAALGAIDQVPGREYPVPDLTERTWENPEPLLVNDWRGRGLPAGVVRDAGVRSTLSVTVPVAGQPWARLTVHDTIPRAWSETEVDFVQTLATILAAASERITGEATQAAVAELGQLALEARDLDTIYRHTVDLAMQALEVPIGILSRWETGDRMRLVYAEGPHPEISKTERPVPMGFDPTSLPDVVRIDDWSQETRFPRSPALTDLGVVSALGVVLHVGTQPWGWLGIGDVRPRRWREVEVDFLRSITAVLRASLERAAGERAQAAISALGRFALQSRDLDATLRRAVDSAMQVLDAPIGALSQWVAPGRIRSLYARGSRMVSTGTELEIPPGLEQAELLSEPLRIEDWDRETRILRPEVAHAEQVNSALQVSVLLQGRPWARLSVFDVRPRQWRDTEVDFIQSLANVMAAAVERDRMEEQLRQRTRQLQRVLMPTELPAVPGMELAARYVPSGGLEVGGDWYDVLQLPHGGAALVMGDVEGHDSAAAAIMGQVRTVLNTYVAEGYPPAEVLARTSNFVNSHTDRLVTCCYAELCPGQRTLTWVSAGHPAPVLLDPTRGARELHEEIGMVLGWEDDPRYQEHTTVLPDGACLMLVTDGLLDVLPGVMYSDLDSLTEVAVPALGRPIEDLADRLVQHHPGTPALRDDAAMLLARLTPTSHRESRRAVRVFGPYPSACVAARSFTRDMVLAWRLAPLASDAELAVSELVTNALTHTTSPIQLTLRSPGPDAIWIGVHDTSDRHPSSPSEDVDPEAIGGRGLLIVNELASAWGVIPSPRRSGKTVWAELVAPPPTWVG